MRGYFSDTGHLVKFIFRRERIITTVWLVILTFMTLSIPVALDNIYTSSFEMQAMAETMKNPAMIAMMGPIYGQDNYTMGAMNTNMMLLFTIISLSIMNIFFVVRHTRADEEQGRIEVIRSLPVGRLSNLGAAMIVASIINAGFALISGIGLTLLGIESMDFAGSLLYGCVMGVSGLFFAAVAALFSQLSQNSKGASGYSLIFLGVCYMLRAVGDINSEVLACISPLGLILRTQVYVKNVWFPVFVILFLTVCVTVLALYLNSIRDMDQGFIPAKPGRKFASPMLQSPVGLALRLLRTTLIGWTVGMFVLGASYGSIMGDLETFIESNEFFKQMLPTDAGFSLAEVFITLIMFIMALSTTIPVLTVILKLRGEEKKLCAEHILSRSVSRTKYMASFFLVSVASSVVMSFITVFGLWSTSAAVMENTIAFSSMLKTMIVYLPAIWCMLGIAVILIGKFPDVSNLIWGYFGFCFFVGYVGRIMQLSEWLSKLSPFGYIPELPLEKINYATLATLTGISIILMIAGFFFYSKRDTKF